MSSIDTYSAAEHWARAGKDETHYLDAIQFVAIDEDGRITLPTDEEGNDLIVLTPKAARHVAKQLLALADEVEQQEAKQ
jgi:hypothetical protein